MESIKTSLLLPREIWKKAKAQALNEGISLGELMRKAIEAYLPKTVSVIISESPKKEKHQTFMAIEEPMVVEEPSRKESKKKGGKK